VQKHLGAIIACDEAEALVVIKEFNFAGWHTSYFPLTGDKCI
jgi:hypothetical protein